MRPHSDNFSQQPVEVGVPSLSERTGMEPAVHTQKLSWLCGNEMYSVLFGFGEYTVRAKLKKLNHLVRRH